MTTPERFEWSGCQNWFINRVFPAGTGPGEAPPSWEPSATQPASNQWISIWECDRISWGEYERGPVRMVYETHTRFAVPAGCNFSVDHDTSSILARWIVDDRELVRAWADYYGFPVEVAPIIVERTSLGDARLLIQATWGGASATIEHSSNGVDGNTPLREGMLVSSHDSLHVLQIRSESSPPEGAVPVALVEDSGPAIGLVSVNLGTPVTATWTQMDSETCPP